MKQPCYKCQARSEMCHTGCKQYAAYREEIQRRNEYNKQFRYIDTMHQTNAQRKRLAQAKARSKGGKQ